MKLLCVILALFNVLVGYRCPEELDKGIWHLAKPYLVPEDHKIKIELDKLFGQNDFRITESLASLKKAGFEVTGTAHTQRLYVLKHKKFKGWIIKIYSDDTPGIQEWDLFIRRCQGANLAKNLIAKYDAEPFFKAPQKYLYLLPSHPTPQSKYEQKFFILLAEDMELVSPETNRKTWRSKYVTAPFLDLFWNVITDGGFADCLFIDNCPFAKDGRIAFIDTEQFHRWPLYYPKLTGYLSGPMQNHWRQLIKMISK